MTASDSSAPCTHFEDNIQPGVCEECVCGDCGAWVGAREIARCGGLCEGCLIVSEEGKTP